jgi:uncharacterized protein YbaR (Trm112 family)
VSPELLKLLCDPTDKSELRLEQTVTADDGKITSGVLISRSGRAYPIRDGIPRFVETAVGETVESFGDEWNKFNYDAFKENWRKHVVANTFGQEDGFRDRVVVDAGAGSGMQSRWIAEAGARRVIALELSHSVDGIMRRNLANTPNVEVVQCSIDSPPLRDECADLVYCHNVIQHTPSVEGTAHALWRLVAPGGELAFNCYARNDLGLARHLRFQFNGWLRSVLSRRSYRVRLAYANVMGALRLVPILGDALELSTMMARGDVPKGPNYWSRAYRQGALNTFDWFGSHSYQHYKSEAELRALLAAFRPEPATVGNLEPYFRRPPPPGCALRVWKGRR